MEETMLWQVPLILSWLDQTLLQGDEELAFSEDAHIILWCAVGPIQVDKKAVWHDEALKLHARIFLVSIINKFLKHTGVTCLVDGAVNEKRTRRGGCPEVGECIRIFMMPSS